MYVIIHKDKVIAGIFPWNSKYFTDVLKIRHKITSELPKNEPNLDKFPYIIDENTVIKRAEEDRQSQINPMIEYYYGPTWEFVDDKVIAHYEVQPLSFDDAKNNYKEKATNLRYAKEISGTKITLDGVEYTIETARDARVKYVEKYTMMSEEPINWKFAEGWKIVSKQDMFNIISAIEVHVQDSFDWEFNMTVQIDSTETIESLLAIEELNVPENNESVIGSDLEV